MQSEKKRIIIVGSGVTGIVASLLLSEKYEVTVLEAAQRLGGHTNTIEHTDSEGKRVAIDTGFIVLNDRTYPTFHRFLKRIGIEARYADMSFSLSCSTTGLEYASRNLDALFAQRRNLYNRRFLKMLLDLRRFWKMGEATLADASDSQTLREWLALHRFQGSIIDDYLLPISCAIWSSPPVGLFDFPVRTFLSFFKNHGLLGYIDQPKWQTIVGGSYQYIKRYCELYTGKLVTDAPVVSVKRKQVGGDSFVEVQTTHQAYEADQVVFCCHADRILPILQDASPLEKQAFGPWRYQNNPTYLHTWSGFMPENRRAWASWNYRREDGEDGTKPVSVTYHMNCLQGLSSKDQYYVTLNPRVAIPEQHLIRAITYDHPVYTPEAVAGRELIRSHNGENNTWYAGSYFGFGFHEDAVRSAVDVAESLGCTL